MDQQQPTGNSPLCFIRLRKQVWLKNCVNCCIQQAAKIVLEASDVPMSSNGCAVSLAPHMITGHPLHQQAYLLQHTFHLPHLCQQLLYRILAHCMITGHPMHQQAYLLHLIFHLPNLSHLFSNHMLATSKKGTKVKFQVCLHFSGHIDQLTKSSTWQ